LENSCPSDGGPRVRILLPPAVSHVTLGRIYQRRERLRSFRAADPPSGKDGVMNITIPKPQEVKQKQHRIEVQKDTSAPSEPSVSRSGRAGEAASSTTSQSPAEQREKETAA